MLYTSHNYKVITYNVAPEKIISYNTLKKSGVAITSTHTEKKKPYICGLLDVMKACTVMEDA